MSFQMILSSKGTRMQQTSQNQHTPLSENLHGWELTDWSLFLLNTHIVMLVLRVHIINFKIASVSISSVDEVI